MKIPTTPPGGAPYYHGPPVNGIEVNPHWQGNGVVIEGPPAGNGAAYILPHVHQAGYAAPPPGYYGPAASPPAPPAGPPGPTDFSEYMWMENEEEFDKQVMQQLEEEALMEQCIEAMLADERDAQDRGALEANLEEQVSKSTLNPLAAEFVPSFVPTTPVASTSDQTIQPSVSALLSAPKSVESSLSELSTSQTSDTPTDSSKTSATEVTEESCTLSVDSCPKQEIVMEEVDIKPVSTDILPVVSAKFENIQIIDDEKTKNEDSCKTNVESPKEQRQAKCESKDIKKNETSVPQEAQKHEVVSARSNLGTKGGVPKGRSIEKPKEPEVKPVSAVIDNTPIERTASIEQPNITDTEKVQPIIVPVPVPTVTPASTPAPFNYAAAARANLPPKPTPPPPTTQPAVQPPAPSQPVIIKQESVPKDTPGQPNQPQSASASSNVNKQPQTRPGPKQNKPNREAKEVGKPGANFPKGPKKNKK